MPCDILSELPGALKPCCRVRDSNVVWPAAEVGCLHIKDTERNLSISRYEAQLLDERGNQEILRKD